MTDEHVVQLQKLLAGIAAGVEDLRKRLLCLEEEARHMRVVTDCLEKRVSGIETSLIRKIKKVE